MKYYFLILLVVLIFFNPIFKGLIPFPGDLLISENPYRTESFKGYNPGSFPNKAQGQDVITEIYPWRYFSTQQLKNGNIPFWNPYNFSGNSQLANFQTAVFYPLNLMYFILPFNISWTLLIVAEPFLAGIFMFIFLTRALKLSSFSGFIGGIAFAFSSYMTVWLEWGNVGHTLLWLPLALFLIRRLNERITAVNFVSLVVVLTLSFLAGYIQGFFYICILSIFYFLYLSGFSIKINKKKFIYFVLSLVLPLILSSFQFLSTSYLFLNSTRGSYTLSQISSLLLPINYWVTAFASDFFGNPATRNYWIQGTYIERVLYVGIPILFFAFVSFKSKTKEKAFFIASALVSLILATNLPLVKFLYLIPIPVISTTVPTRELSIFIFSMITLGAIGINFWEKEKIKIKLPWVFAGFYIFLFIITFILMKNGFLTPQNFSITLRNLFLPTLLAVFTIVIFKFLERNLFSKFILTVIVVADLFYFFNKITPFSPTDFVYPKTPVVSFLQKNAGINRFWGYGSAYINPNFQTYDKTFTTEGNDPLHIQSYGSLLASSANGKIPEILPRPDANIAPGYGSSDLANNFYRQRILNLLGVKYVLNQSNSDNFDSAFPPEKYSLVWQKSPWQVYQNKEVLPRFFMANDYKIYKRNEDVLNAIYDKNIDLGKTLFLKSMPDIDIDKNSMNSIQLLSYEPNKVMFQTKNSGNSLLFLSDNYYPQWNALVDGKKINILLADYTFKAVAVPKGEHKIEFVYDPKYFSIGIVISLIGFIALIFLTYDIKKNEKV